MSDLSQLIHTWKSLSVLVIGDVILDGYLSGEAERLCQEAPVPVVTITQRQDFAGGAANVAANLTSLGATAFLLSAIGQDDAGDRLQAALTQQGIATAGLIRSARSTLAKQRVMANSHLLVRFDQGSTEPVSLAIETQLIEQLTTLFPQCDAVIVSDYGYGILTPRIIQTLAALQHQHPRPCVIDSKQLQVYQSVGATAVKPNYREVIQLLGLPKQTDRRVEQLLTWGDRVLNVTGAHVVAVTLDREGSLFFERDRPPFHLPAKPVPANQTSGAGDTFVSVLALALAKQSSVAIAAYLAATATALVVTQIGTMKCNLEALDHALHQPLIENSHLPSFTLPTYA